MLELLKKLDARIQAANDPRDIVDALNDYAWSVMRTDLRSAMTRAEQALELAKNFSYEGGVARSLRNRGLCHHQYSNYEAALHDINEALYLFRKVGDASGEASALNNLGSIYADLGEYTRALDYFEQSYKLYRDLDYKIGEAASITNLGDIYYRLGEYSRALGYFQQSLELYKDIKHKQGEATALASIGNVYSALGAHTQALNNLLASLQLFESLGDKQSLATTLKDIGAVYEKLDSSEQAIEYFERSLSLMEQIGDRHGQAIVQLSLGQFLLSKELLDQAQPHLERSLEVAEEINAKPEIYRAHQALAELYKLKGNYRSAFDHIEKFYQIRSEVIGEELNRKLTNQKITFAVEKAEKEAEIYRLKTVELAQANKALEEANALKTELLHIAAHDLKNPLTAVMTFAELIREQADDVEFVRTQAQAIYQSTEQMFNLVKSLLEQAALESGKVELNKKVVDIATIAEFVVKHNEMNAHNKGQQIHLALEREAYAEVDVEKMQSIFDNLISNAIKYSPHGRHIWVSVKKKLLTIDGVELTSGNIPTKIIFEVRDEGLGLTEEDKQKLFGKFQRLSARPTGGESSSGLGLAIVKQWVELHGGRVWAESEGKNKGATFFVELNAAEKPAALEAETA
ncbi:MAG: tetratricopeptide repeat-containing sensor histidine kinase [Chloroherpetonaceae bacterium]|nr:tetratricopeptide repeat-containing sensor histidine kinase [Chloroherpetonaceae bacterium]MCS7210161.1 tetratricopeptide repeat-containing sensor histidine kinase [Chloroherpetonaceae bacterium]MDW8019258.1 tetratricopeptide repeat-containing sensor histidine kinase [Chloroherpetonaceae bacterium]